MILSNKHESLMIVIIDGNEFVTNMNTSLPLKTSWSHTMATSK